MVEVGVVVGPNIIFIDACPSVSICLCSFRNGEFQHAMCMSFVLGQWPHSKAYFIFAR